MQLKEASAISNLAIELQTKTVLIVLKRLHLRQVQAVLIPRRQHPAHRQLQQQFPPGGFAGRQQHPIRAELQEDHSVQVHGKGNLIQYQDGLREEDQRAGLLPQEECAGSGLVELLLCVLDVRVYVMICGCGLVD